jgi:hypothetical protein
MKTLLLKSVVIIGCFLFISSCSVEKRLYSSGYYVSWNKRHVTTSKSNLTNHELNNQTELAHSGSVVEIESKSSDQVFVQNVVEPLINNNIVESSEVTNYSNSLISIETKQTASLIETKRVETKSDFQESKRDIKKNIKKSKEARQNGGKLQIVALILCILLGLIGVHRFYLGYNGLGILYLLTLGIFGIGWIIDIILLIIPNGLTPKGRSNYKAD